MKKLLFILVSIITLIFNVGCNSSGQGTYTFVDEKGFNYTIILNPNKTAIIGKGKPNEMFGEAFGEWAQKGDVIVTDLNTSGIWWNAGPGTASTHSAYFNVIYDGYIYSDIDGFEAGSKKYRLPIRKIN